MISTLLKADFSRVFFMFGEVIRIRAAGKSGRAGSARRRGIVKGDKLSPLTDVLMREKKNRRAGRNCGSPF
ncbi:MAG TPA: hypothetical protein DGP36_03815 [Ruminococcus sp.]|nr:hypothetical protein [Ruminococcus sp.]